MGDYSFKTIKDDPSGGSKPHEDMSDEITYDAPTMRDAPQRPSGPRVGDRLVGGRYEVLSELGRGGMGVVYRCMDNVAGVEVALKALPPELSHNHEEMEEVRENFQLVSRLVHQNIAVSKTLEKEERSGDYYLVMECVVGEDLRKWMRGKRKEQGGITLEEALPILEQVAAALDYAHGKKVMHRDIKPANIMLTSDGTVKVMDFGLAAQIHSSMSHVSRVYHGTSGTQSYMSPEQWRGKAQGAAADQYALAVTAYEMLSGHLPFDASDTDVLKKAVLEESAESIDGLSDSANDALKRALSKDASDRFPTCGAFIDALEGKTPRLPSPASVRTTPRVSGGEVERLLKRVSLFLRTDDFDKAIEYCERILDKEPENAQAYLYRLMAENRIKTEDDLWLLPDGLEKYKTFKLLMEFADADMRSRMEFQCQKQRDAKVYESLKPQMAKQLSFSEWKELAGRFSSIKGFKDADELGRQCEGKAQKILDDARQEYKSKYEKSVVKKADWDTSPEKWEALAKEFDSLANLVPEAAAAARQCRENAKSARFRNACKLMLAAHDRKGYEGAAAAFERLMGESPDARAKIEQCRESIRRLDYQQAVDLMNRKEYDEAMRAFTALDDYADSKALIERCREDSKRWLDYQHAVDLMNQRRYDDAIQVFTALGNYADSSTMVGKCKRWIDYQHALDLMKRKEYDEAIQAFTALDDFADSRAMVGKCREDSKRWLDYQHAVDLMNQKKYAEAIQVFTALDDYADSKAMVGQCRENIRRLDYQHAVDLMKQKKYAEAIQAFTVLDDFSDSTSLIKECRRLQKYGFLRRLALACSIVLVIILISVCSIQHANQKKRMNKINLLSVQAQVAITQLDFDAAWNLADEIAKLDDNAAQKTRDSIRDAKSGRINGLNSEIKQAIDDSDFAKANNLARELGKIDRGEASKARRLIAEKTVSRISQLECDIDLEIAQQNYTKASELVSQMERIDEDKALNAKSKILKAFRKDVQAALSKGDYDAVTSIAKQMEKYDKNAPREWQAAIDKARKFKSLTAEVQAAISKLDFLKAKETADKIAEFDGKMANDLKARIRQAEIDKLVGEVDEAILQSDFQKAKETADKIAVFDDKMANDLKARIRQAEIDKLIGEGNEAISQSNFRKAKETADKIAVLDDKMANDFKARIRQAEVDKLVGEVKAAISKSDFQKANKTADKIAEIDPSFANELKGILRFHDEKCKENIFDMFGCPVKMIRVRAGRFQMGSPDDELGRYRGENWHWVTLTKDFWLGETEVTQGQWKAVMGTNPSHFKKGDDYPVEEVSWEDAMEFCKKLNQKYAGILPSGYKFSLPTEAQWEYACRAGTTTALNSGKDITSEEGRCPNLDKVGWYSGNSGSSTHPVAQKRRNDWGFYDMHGNVWEWCFDWYDSYGDGATDPQGPKTGWYRVLRGGSWNHGRARHCRSAYRNIDAPSDRDYFRGFRVAFRPIP